MSVTELQGAPQNILLFRRGAAPHRARPEVDLHGGRILFFTGVRYERMRDEAVSGPDGGPRSDDGASRKKRRRA